MSLEKVDAICDLAVEKHDTFRTHILKILSDLADLMDIDQLHHLFDKVKSFPPQEIDNDILQLIKNIGINTSFTQNIPLRKTDSESQDPASPEEEHKESHSPGKDKVR